jgi:hypothetical protein
MPMGETVSAPNSADNSHFTLPGEFYGIVFNKKKWEGFAFVKIDTVRPLVGELPVTLPRDRDLFMHVKHNPRLGKPLPDNGTAISFKLMTSPSRSFEVCAARIYKE